jgi:translation initiation factor 2 beta subunit (eIF-2beta)/eIF-5
MANLRFSPGLLSSIRDFGEDLAGSQAGAASTLTGAGVQPASLGGMLARNVGTMLGRDMRTPAEKLAEAQQGINLGTYEGQIAAAQARLKFETDPVKKEEIGKQIINLQNSQAQAARAAAAEARTVKQEKEKEERQAKVVSSLENAGASQIAAYVKDGTYTSSQGAQHLGSLIRVEKAAAESLESQQEIITALGYDKQKRFSFLFGEDAKPVSSEGLLRILVNEAEEEEVINKGVARLKKMPQSANVTAAISFLEEGLMTPQQASAFATRADKMTVPKTGEFKLKDGTAVATSVVNGELMYLDTATAEFVAPTANNPLVPIVAKGKQVKITPASKKALESVLDVELGILDEAQRQRHGLLSGKDAYTFNIAATHLADLRSQENKTPVEAEMQRAVVDLLDSEYYTSESGTPYVGRVIGEKYTPARFVMPETFSEFGITSPSRLDGPTERTQKFLTKE